MNAATFAGEYDVAIVGLGPTGLTLAHLLGLRGLRVLALEREPEFYGNARAVYTDDECMRVFQAAGVAAELEADMLVDTPVQWVLEDGSVLSQLRRMDRPYGWAVSNFFYQPYLETKMEKLLERYPNVTALRGREVVGFSHDETGVTVEHAASSGTRYGQANPTAEAPAETARARAQWLVACDGGRSDVRARLGIKMAGKSFPEPWLVVDIKAKEGEDCFRHMPYFNFHCDPKQPTVSCPQPNGHHRFEFLLMPGQTKDEMEDRATVLRLLAQYVDVDKVEVLRRLVYTFNALVAERWRDGRVLLAGDAAHMTPQFMGQGMSSGVRDAHNLAWKLDAVLRKGADPKLIETYQSERKPHAKEMIDISVKMKDFVSIANPVLAKTRNVVVKNSSNDAESRRLHSRGALQAAADLSERRLFRPTAQAAERRRGTAHPAAGGAHVCRASRPARRPSRRRLRARRLRLRPAREPRRTKPRAALSARRNVRGALSVWRAPAGRRGQALCGGRADRGGGPWRRRDRLVPRGRREEGPCRPRPPGQVRLRPDAGRAAGAGDTASARHLRQECDCGQGR